MQHSVGTMEVFFQTKPCLVAHVQAILQNRQDYINTLLFLCEGAAATSNQNSDSVPSTPTPVSTSRLFQDIVSNSTKACILAALHITKQHKLLSRVLQHCQVVPVLKMLQMLDQNRRLRQLTAKITKIETDHPHLKEQPKDNGKGDTVPRSKKGKQRGKHGRDVEQTTNLQNDTPTNVEVASKRRRCNKLNRYRRAKRQMETANAILMFGGNQCPNRVETSASLELISSDASVSGALARKVRYWAKTTLSSDLLEFILLGMPTDAWKEIADVVHFQPSDFVLGDFLHQVYATDHNDKSNDETTVNGFVPTMRVFLKTIEEEAQSKSEEEALEHQFSKIGREYPQLFCNYALLRRYPKLLSNNRIMEDLARHVPLDTVLWHYEEFHTASSLCETIVSERLRSSAMGEL